MAHMKTIFAYLVYAAAITVVLLYLQFPADALKSYVDHRLASADPSLTLATETIRPAIPPGLTMTGVALYQEGTRLVLFDKLRIVPNLRTLLKSNKKVNFTARVAEGSIAGWAIIEGNRAEHLQVEADLSDIQLEGIDLIKADTRFTVTGILTGHVNHDDGSGAAETTNATMGLSDVQITLQDEFFGMRDIVVGKVDATLAANRKSLRIKSLDFDGPMAQGKIGGSIDLRQPLGQSRLNLSGNAKPKPALFARLQDTIPAGFFDARTLGTIGINFAIRGSIENPQASMR